MQHCKKDLLLEFLKSVDPSDETAKWVVDVLLEKYHAELTVSDIVDNLYNIIPLKYVSFLIERDGISPENVLKNLSFYVKNQLIPMKFVKDNPELLNALILLSAASDCYLLYPLIYNDDWPEAVLNEGPWNQLNMLLAKKNRLLAAGYEIEDDYVLACKSVRPDGRSFYNTKISYEVGKTYYEQECDFNPKKTSGAGFSAGTRKHAIEYAIGRGYAELHTILCVKIPIAKVVLTCEKKLRCAEMTILSVLSAAQFSFNTLSDVLQCISYDKNFIKQYFDKTDVVIATSTGESNENNTTDIIAAIKYLLCLVEISQKPTRCKVAYAMFNILCENIQFLRRYENFTHVVVNKLDECVGNELPFMSYVYLLKEAIPTLEFKCLTKENETWMKIFHYLNEDLPTAGAELHVSP